MRLSKPQLLSCWCRIKMMTPGQICPFHAPANMKQRTKKFRVQAANVAHLVECLPSMHNPPGWTLVLY